MCVLCWCHTSKQHENVIFQLVPASSHSLGARARLNDTRECKQLEITRKSSWIMIWPTHAVRCAREWWWRWIVRACARVNKHWIFIPTETRKYSFPFTSINLAHQVSTPAISPVSAYYAPFVGEWIPVNSYIVFLLLLQNCRPHTLHAYC